MSDIYVFHGAVHRNSFCGEKSQSGFRKMNLLFGFFGSFLLFWNREAFRGSLKPLFPSHRILYVHPL